MPRARAPSLADVAALAVALERDEQRPPKDRQAEDLAIAEEMGERRLDRMATSLAWLDGICARDAQMNLRREQARALISWTGILMTLLGLIVGWGAALGALYYDGSGRVNVIAVLAVFVFLPGAFLVLFALAASPPSTTRYLPGASAAAALSRGLSPGRLALLILRRLPREWREAWERVAGRAGMHQTLYAGLQKWALLRWSQLFGLGFQIAAVSAACWLVVFSDLAFGWSTTLTTGNPATDASRLHAATTAMAAPWSWAIEGAEPSLGLVRESRYYRAVAQSITPEEAARLGGWWRFLVAAMLVYGLFPRILTLVIAHKRLRARARAAFDATPGLTALLNRLHRSRIQTTALDSETPFSAPDVSAISSTGAQLGDRFGAVVNWAALPVADSALSARFGGARIVHAGGGSSLDADRALIRSFGDAADHNGEETVIAVKAWEPPLLELSDFLRDLRRAIGEGHDLLVVPIAVGDEGRPERASSAQCEIWRRQLARVKDPWLRVVDLPSEVVS